MFAGDGVSHCVKKLGKSKYGDKMIIGVTGTNGAGKSTVLNFLKHMGFSFYSCSDEIREELIRNNIPETRESLIAMGNGLREKFGPGILAARIKKKISDAGGTKNFVIDSIRNPSEVEELRKLEGFKLIAVDAPIEERFKRLMSRQKRGIRNESAVTLEKFAELEKREMSENPSSQQLHKVMKLADSTIINDGSVAEIEKKLWNLFSKDQRIGIDE